MQTVNVSGHIILRFAAGSVETLRLNLIDDPSYSEIPLLITFANTYYRVRIVVFLFLPVNLSQRHPVAYHHSSLDKDLYESSIYDRGLGTKYSESNAIIIYFKYGK